ncbi:GNAT family N-acetyltransferase [Kordiimonas aquimaris]|uniref:GNAT family N-acetyltransferase n=1 Tax=Kordiimonas aquimaris TaxID=707591 RepID=UPI0021D17E50|nr:GNAT family N-acetyltransferase [Kordiimonas aquimaris]
MLTLRSIPDTDLDAFFHMLNDPTLAVNTGSIPYPITRAWAQERLDKKRAMEVAGTAQDWGLYDGETLVGNAGWFTAETGGREIGYAIHRDHRGKGYATQAARLVVERIRSDGYRDKIYAGYFKDNPASGRVLEKLGFEFLTETLGEAAARTEPSPSIEMVLQAEVTIS